MRDRNEAYWRTLGVLRHRVGDAGFAHEVFGTVLKQLQSCVRPRQSGQNRADGLREQRPGGALCDGLIWICRQDGEELDALFRVERGGARADSKLPRVGGAAGADLFDKLRINRALRVVSPGLCG